MFRAIVGAWFAIRIGRGADSWLSSVDSFAAYLRLDGITAIIGAILLLVESRRTDARRAGHLAVVLLVDGIGRLVSGFAAQAWPGLLEFPVTLVMFFGVMAVCTGAVGIAEGALVVEEEIARHGHRHEGPQFQAGPVGAGSALSLAFGIAAMIFVGDPSLMRKLVVGYIASVAIVMMSLALPVARRGRLTAILPR